jgi:ssDNA-binding replication factor A large subunit
MARALKVFRTPIGFHDAYVAAPSQKVALEAWGSERDLFARGIAERVDDPALTKAPLARPGDVIRVLRQSPDESAVSQKGSAGRTSAEKKPGKPKPRPSRAALDRAEAALERLKREQQEERDALTREEAALAKRRRSLEARQARAIASLENRLERTEASYRHALDRWRG